MKPEVLVELKSLRLHGMAGAWADLVEQGGNAGIESSRWLIEHLLQAETALKSDPVAAAYFYRPDGLPHPVGHVLKNPALAAVLREIAAQGPRALHELHIILKGDRHADGGDERSQARRVAQRPVGDALDDHVDQHGDRDRAEDRDRSDTALLRQRCHM